MTLDAIIQKAREKTPLIIGGLSLALLLNTGVFCRGMEKYQVGAFSNQANATKMVSMLQSKGFTIYTSQQGEITKIIAEGTKSKLEAAVGTPVFAFKGKNLEKVPEKAEQKKTVNHINSSYKDFLRKINKEVEDFHKEKKLNQGVNFLLKYYDNFSANDLINIVRCVDKEAGGKWHENEGGKNKKREKEKR